MINDISFQSLTAVPSDRNCPDGDLDISLNVINEDGELKPIAAPRPAGTPFALTSSQARIVTIHKFNDGDHVRSHYIICNRDSSQWCWAESDSGEVHDIGISTSTIPYDSAVTAIGRMLCFVSQSITIYALWKGGQYSVFSTDLFAYQLKLKPGSGYDDTSVGVLNTFSVEQVFDKEMFNSFFITNYGGDKKRISSVGARAIYNALDAERNKRIEERGDTYFKGKVLGVAAVRLYDGSYTNISMPFVIDNDVSPKVGFNTDDCKFINMNYTCNTAAIIVTMDTTALTDIVSGIDIFLTREEDFLDIDTTIDISNLPDVILDADGTFSYPYLTQDKVYDKIDRMLFYRSISIEPSQFGTECPLHRVTGVETTLSLADTRNCAIGGATAITYNSRLHIASTRTTLAGGTLATTLEPEAMDGDYGTKVWKWGTYRTAYIKGTIDGGRNISLKTAIPYPLPSIIAFPANKLTSATLLVVTGESNLARKYLAIPLAMHSSSTASLSYFTQLVDGSLKPPVIESSHYVTSERDWAIATQGASSRVVIASSPSLVKVSEPENPIVFPAKNSVQVGSSAIMALAANTRPISEGQFGSAPLYAFTDEGVWVLMVGAEGTYQSRQPVSRNICSNVRGILQTDDAVLFPTARGIMLQQGSTATCITDTIDTTTPFSITSVCSQEVVRQLCAYSGVDEATLGSASLRTFLSGADMIYAYADARIILFNPSYTYAYVYSLRSGTWATMPSALKSRVIGCYPEAYAVSSDGHIIDVAQPTDTQDASSTPYLLCTRPIALSSPDVMKAVQALAVRGLFNGDKACATALFASNDLHHWFLVASSTDHRLRPISGSPYKFFRIVCTGTLADGQALTGATMQFIERRKNKLR